VYIVAIGWLYVTFMMAITERSVVAGIMTFVFYGLLPVMVILYLGGVPQRRRARARAEAAQAGAKAEQPDRSQDVEAQATPTDAASAEKTSDTPKTPS
jgi:hypothetical protein